MPATQLRLTSLNKTYVNYDVKELSSLTLSFNVSHEVIVEETQQLTSKLKLAERLLELFKETNGFLHSVASGDDGGRDQACRGFLGWLSCLFSS